MSNLTSVHVTAGIPDSGTGTVSTLDNLVNLTIPVSLASAPTTPVTGTFFQATQPVSLASAPTTPVTGTFFQATQPVSLASAPTTPVTGTFWQATQPISGSVTTSPTVASTGTQSIVASSASSVTVLASNSSRLGATVYNDSTAILYLLLKTGGTASNTVYSVQIQPNGYYEVPFTFTGALIGIWSAANGNARVTELTA